jgi:hypothetical protein
VEQGYGGKVLFPIVDPPAVAAAKAHGGRGHRVILCGHFLSHRDSPYKWERCEKAWHYAPSNYAALCPVKAIGEGGRGVISFGGLDPRYPPLPLEVTVDRYTTGAPLMAKGAVGEIATGVRGGEVPYFTHSPIKFSIQPAV